MSRNSRPTQHPYIPVLVEDLKSGTISRRHFLRTATLLGLSAVTAYTLSGEANPFIGEAQAADALPKGGHLRIGMRCMEIKSPHQSDFAEKSNVIRQVCEFLTFTGNDNITRQIGRAHV